LLRRSTCARRRKTALRIGTSSRAIKGNEEARVGTGGNPRGIERAGHHHREREETCANEQISERGHVLCFPSV
jgi:hypothetical protein